MLPVEGVADAVIEIVPPLARKAGHFPQDPKWQMGLQVEAMVMQVVKSCADPPSTEQKLAAVEAAHASEVSAMRASTAWLNNRHTDSGAAL